MSHGHQMSHGHHMMSIVSEYEETEGRVVARCSQHIGYHICGLVDGRDQLT